MAKIISLKTKRKPKLVPLPVNRELVKQMEIVLKQCKVGEITGVIVVTNARCEWTGTMRWGVMTYAMVGRLHEMIRNTLAAMDD